LQACKHCKSTFVYRDPDLRLNIASAPTARSRGDGRELALKCGRGEAITI